MPNDPKSKKELEKDAENRAQTKYGKTVAQVRSKWGNEVKITSKGYISITGLLGTLEIPEKLISIDFVDQFQVNPLVSKNPGTKSRGINEGQIRDTYLIYVTTERSDSLHWSDNNNSTNAEILRLVAMARAAIAGQLGEFSNSVSSGSKKRNPFKNDDNSKEQADIEDKGSEDDLAAQLSDLVQMHKNGDLTDDEFKKAKTKLLASSKE
jgi:hypothetical protein